MADAGYTDTDVELIACAMYEDDEASTPGGWYVPWADVNKATWQEYTSRARAALSALAATGRLLPTDATVVIECEIDWVDVRSIRADAYGKAYAWPPETFDAWLAKEIEAAGQFHRAPVSMRKRTVSTFSDGSALVGPWLPAPVPAVEPA